MTDKEQAIYTALLFVTMFRERAIVSGSRSSIGKGNRSISYLIFRTLHKEMPRTAIACIPYFVHFGYWGDLNAICAHYIKDGNDKQVVAKCIDMMLESLDKSVRSLPGAKNRGFLKKNGDVMTHSEFRKGLDGHRLKIQSLSDDRLRSIIVVFIVITVPSSFLLSTSVTSIFVRYSLQECFGRVT